MSLDQFLGIDLMHKFSGATMSYFFDPCFARSLYSYLGPNMIHSTKLLVPLIMLSYNHQNHKQWPSRAMFLTISLFFVIDDNTIKASIKFAKVDKLNHLHLFGWLLPSNACFASP